MFSSGCVLLLLFPEIGEVRMQIVDHHHRHDQRVTSRDDNHLVSLRRFVLQQRFRSVLFSFLLLQYRFTLQVSGTLKKNVCRVSKGFLLSKQDQNAISQENQCMSIWNAFLTNPLLL